MCLSYLQLILGENTYMWANTTDFKKKPGGFVEEVCHVAQ